MPLNRFTIPGRLIFEPDPSNAPGPFYVAHGCCLCCYAPEREAPGMVGRNEGEYESCFFKKQPTTPEELDRAIAAMNVSCIPGLRYAGADPEVLRRLQEKELADRCDVLIPPEKIPPAGGDPGPRMIDLDCALHPDLARRIGKTGWAAAPPE
jgi:hypothetical protein